MIVVVCTYFSLNQERLQILRHFGATHLDDVLLNYDSIACCLLVVLYSVVAAASVMVIGTPAVATLLALLNRLQLGCLNRLAVVAARRNHVVGHNHCVLLLIA